MHGRGVLRLENGDKYEGDFVAGRMHGVGRYVATDGSIYLGEFRDGLRHGLGKLTLVEGAFRTVWREGREIERRPVADARRQKPSRPAAGRCGERRQLKLSLDRQAAPEFEG